ncbi:hypothetical protein OH76DRAFT_458998 [Lentinus brumalis]|uniref:Uncharacterized protein n=1 Tax=Lentinus brumalis TaxID=2498619 RepID=A0A371DDE5_9APHY|nr:hypothetical protein OH76DRAFT_458998 [Polyporus brumalis]
MLQTRGQPLAGEDTNLNHREDSAVLTPSHRRRPLQSLLLPPPNPTCARTPSPTRAPPFARTRSANAHHRTAAHSDIQTGPRQRTCEALGWVVTHTARRHSSTSTSPKSALRRQGTPSYLTTPRVSPSCATDAGRGYLPHDAPTLALDSQRSAFSVLASCALSEAGTTAHD